MTTVEPEESDLLSAFRLIDEQLAAAPQAGNLVVFRERLIAELVGDADRVAATLAPDFSLVTHVGGKTLTSGRDQLVASIQRLGAAPGGALMWLRLESLVADRTTVAGHGFLVTLTAAPSGGLRRTVGPLAFFVTSDGPLITSESLYLDPPADETTVLPDATLADRQRCLDLVGGLPQPTR
ncbi:hypothetical protein MXD61_16265 [Frankia sp. AgPm24]|uniref:SnoaL-like domain-containing protein n=1 Tax=Frankia umida TaxID=573489 RepID=A0ABT0JVB4_9ACTN|nr:MULTISPECIES: hypothetical protein [Frankia]MCK9875157.1 hypothetical protein [Frankia umida]MCK9923404.1 hypothetical protein [Frankia sp. AgPm24]